jgi:transcriptional regulator with XRE-family HTH domain
VAVVSEDLDFARFFKELGGRLRAQRQRRRYTQEDMIGFGFSARHWQQVEAGRPITLKTLVRACRVFDITLARILRGLDREVPNRPSAGRTAGRRRP